MSIREQAVKTLASLTGEQRGKLDSWLLDGGLKPDEVIQRCREQFSVTVSTAALAGYLRKARLNRNLERIASCATDADALTRQFAEHPADTYQLLLSLSGQLAFELALKSEGNLDRRAVLDFTKLLIAARRDDRDLEKRAFDREKWEFDAAEACMEKLPELKAVSADSTLTFKEKLRQVRLRLFGIAPE